MTASFRWIAHAWLGVGLTGLLLALSLTGDGTGLLRNGRIAHPAWSYGLVLASILLLVTLAGRSRPKVNPR